MSNEIGVYAKRIIEFLEKRKISCVGDIERRPEERANLDTLPDFIELGQSFSQGSQSYRVSYVIPNYGIPLEVVFRPQIGYMHIIAKSTELLEGFIQFSLKDLTGIRQTRVLYALDFETLNAELKKLKGFSSS